MALYCWGLFIVGIFLLMLQSSIGEDWGMVGGVLIVIALVWGITIKFRVWWHHE